MNPENIHLPNKTLVFAIPALLLLLSVMAVQPALGMTLDEFNKLPGPAIPFSCDKSGCHNDDVLSNAPASSAKSESASAAKSQNNVKCFAFCLGLSTANSGSAADANSRTNSPGDTATVQPVTPRTTTQPNLSVNPNEITPLNTAGTQCIDNTGSHQDIGYLQGYADGQRDFQQNLGFDNSLHRHHTDEFKTGYKDGYQAGFDDAQLNVFKNPC